MALVAVLLSLTLITGQVHAGQQSNGEDYQQRVVVKYNFQWSNSDLQNIQLKGFEDLEKKLQQFDFGQFNLNDFDSNFNWQQLEERKQEEPQVDEPAPQEQEQQEQPADQEPTEEQAPEEPVEQEEASQPEESAAEENQQQVEEPAASDVHAYEQQVAELVNQERQKHGLQPVELSSELSNVARDKSQDMATNNYFSHQSPTYGSPFDMMQAYGIDYRTAGENIAKGQRSPEQVMNGWMNSEGHRANILNENFTHIGVGYVESNGSTYWTQMFIGK
ncbi:hypothetical protein CEY16_13825 [Halalkalibacillus sediminis]|uniref:SCP domain-containing protein n=2 Tax=Halalkalibacillus sediminis TaxID=2018042 RepID=A0A2I0QRP1_9BACI|nr:hypothetical protein CEY16_13825 [Halalkalibacillus sediminis]